MVLLYFFLKTPAAPSYINSKKTGTAPSKNKTTSPAKIDTINCPLLSSKNTPKEKQIIITKIEITIEIVDISEKHTNATPIINNSNLSINPFIYSLLNKTIIIIQPNMTFVIFISLLISLTKDNQKIYNENIK